MTTNGEPCAFCPEPSADVAWFRIGEERCPDCDTLLYGENTNLAAWLAHVHLDERHWHLHLCTRHWDWLKTTPLVREGWAPLHVALTFDPTVVAPA